LAIIKFFPIGYFYHVKESPLSVNMIIALKKVCASEKKRKPFGPKDMKRSLYPLIERGLIRLTYFSINDGKKATWGVTKKGLENLQSLKRK
jgi:chromosome segregation and condensation protein ScpB